MDQILSEGNEQLSLESRFSFRSWKEQDREWLYGALESFLKETSQAGGDVLPTNRNINAYIELGLRRAGLGDPCFVGFLGNRPVGFVFWVGNQNSDLDERWKTILALGSFTEARARHFGVANKLRLLALEQAKKMGYERIQGPVYLNNERGLEEFTLTYNAVPVAVIFEKMIGEKDG